MNEAAIVQKLRAEIKKQLPQAVTLKLQDYITTGIPDLSVNYKSWTSWVEVKLLRRDETRSEFRKHFDKLQLATMMLLERQVRAYYFLGAELQGGLKGIIIRPERLSHLLEHQVYDIGNFMMPADYFGEFNPAVDHLIFLLSRPGGGKEKCDLYS